MTDPAEQKTCLPLIEVEKVLPILHRISIFAGLNEKRLYALFRRLERLNCRSGQMVFHQGDRPSEIYIVQSGRIKLYVEEEDTTYELIVFGTGQCFGEASMIGIQPHAASAVAIEDTELIVLTRKALMDLYECDPKLFGILVLNIAREVCRRLHASDHTLLHYVLHK